MLDSLLQDSGVNSVAAGGQVGSHVLFGSLKFRMTDFRPFIQRRLLGTDPGTSDLRAAL